MKALKDFKKGEYFTLKNVEYPNDSQVWIKGEYDRSLRAYECTNFSDISRFKYITGNTYVYDEFIF